MRIDSTTQLVPAKAGPAPLSTMAFCTKEQLPAEATICHENTDVKKHHSLLKPDGLTVFTSKRTLALDLGTRTGWTLTEGAAVLESGTFNLATQTELRRQRKLGAERTMDLRFGRFLDFVRRAVRENGIKRFVFEDVLFTKMQIQAQVWTSLRSVIWLQPLENPGIEVLAVPSTTLKFFATEKGNASKEEMAAALVKRVPGYLVQSLTPVISVRKPNGGMADDNEVDSLWLALYALDLDCGRIQHESPFERRLRRQEQRLLKADNPNRRRTSGVPQHPVNTTSSKL